MNAPITKTGNSEARQQARGAERKPEELGDGHIMGNLTDDPELRFTATGRAVAKLRLAYTPRVKNATTGAWEDAEPEFYTLNAWGQQAENCAEFLRRGDRVVAAGTWVKRFWEDREGRERESVDLTVKDIGPSLLFRGASVVRTKRTKGGASGE